MSLTVGDDMKDYMPYRDIIQMTNRAYELGGSFKRNIRGRGTAR